MVLCWGVGYASLVEQQREVDENSHTLDIDVDSDRLRKKDGNAQCGMRNAPEQNCFLFFYACIWLLFGLLLGGESMLVEVGLFWCRGIDASSVGLYTRSEQH